MSTSRRYVFHGVAIWLILVVMNSASLGQTLKVGAPAPDFTVPLLDGKSTVRLSDFRGRRVLIFTWASW